MNLSCEIQVQVTRNAKKPGISIHSGNILKLKVTAQAVEGKGKEAVVGLLSERLKCSTGQIVINHGLKFRDKRVCLHGFSRDCALKLLFKGDT